MSESEQQSTAAEKSDDADSRRSVEADPAPRSKLKKWLIRYGPIGVFLFFLIKGLVWVALALLAWWGLRGGS